MKTSIAIIISANTEWKALKSIYKPEKSTISHTPYGEMFKFKVNQIPINVFYGGWGKISAAASAQYIIGNYKPELIINLGTCGGFEGQIRSGDLIHATKALSYDIYEKMFDSKAAIDNFTTNINNDWLNIKGLKRETIVSGDKDIDPKDIDYLNKEFEAKAGDWESASIAFVADKNKTDLVIIRGVSDVISKTHGEAYNDTNIFIYNTAVIMNKLFKLLPKIIMQYDRNNHECYEEK
jgi:adenosylhomocysteine nucleosidase